MKKYLIIGFLIVSSILNAGYYLKDQKPSESSEKPKVVGGGFSFKGENGIPVKNDETSTEKTNVSTKNIKAAFLHPMDFENTEEQKQQVIKYIKVQTKKTLETINSYNNILAREMEQQELNSFKALTKAKDRETMDNIIRQLNSINSLNYIMLKEMYDQEMMASNQELTW